MEVGLVESGASEHLDKNKIILERAQGLID